MTTATSSSGRSDDGLKYARGAGARIPPGLRPLGILERITLLQVGIFVVAATWAFGGQADWVQVPLAWWGSLGLLITLSALQDREAWREGWMRPLAWMWPIVGFNLVVMAGCFNPSLRELKIGAETMLLQEDIRPGLPSSARPELALHALWVFDAIWISAFNLVLVIRQRRALRFLLLIMVLNAAVLAVFGTVQKLGHAHGLYFDAVASPQFYFFASFVYHNHWGAFIVLMMAAALGLVWHHGRRLEARDFLHTPAFGGVVVLLLLAITIPLSTSRSCTLLALGLFAATGVHWLRRLVRKRRRFRESIALPLAGGGAAVILAAAAVWFVARESITARLARTTEQVAEMRTRGGIGDRAELYRNTWDMARARPWFGWGMASYPHVFTLYQTRHSVDRLPVFYHDAHSDWLQSLAEHGFIGSALLALAALLPLLRLKRRHLTSPVPGYLLGGCALIVLYAWVEFPFGNLAVVLVWWCCFFSAIQYARLQDREAATPAKAPEEISA